MFHMVHSKLNVLQNVTSRRYKVSCKKKKRVGTRISKEKNTKQLSCWNILPKATSKEKVNWNEYRPGVFLPLPIWHGLPWKRSRKQTVDSSIYRKKAKM